MSSPAVSIGNRTIGAGHPCWIVAEVSANHNQSLDRAIAIVRAAKQAGADAIKLQTYTAATLTLDSDREYFRIAGDGLWAGRTLYELYEEAHTPWSWHEPILAVAREEGLECFSTPFDDSAVDFLEGLHVPAYKIASFELVDTGLLRKVAATGKPVIASVGMATLAEIEQAVATLRAHHAGPLVLLKCTSAYPASASDMNLRTIPNLASTFDVVAGLSDHTLGNSVAVAAVVLGAAVVEKHFTLARADGGPDAAFSMEPEEFARMVKDIRSAEQALGRVSYERTPSDAGSLQFRRSLFVVQDIRAGEPFSEANVRSIRPAHGLSPCHLTAVLGRRATRDIARATPLSWEMVAADHA